MSTLRPFRADDLFKFNNINLDPLTETYHIPFYLGYLAQWPSICATYEDHTGRLAGYILGKAEGDDKLWHGHVTALTVAPEFRRLGVGKTLMDYLGSHMLMLASLSFFILNYCRHLLNISFSSTNVSLIKAKEFFPVSFSIR